MRYFLGNQHHFFVEESNQKFLVDPATFNVYSFGFYEKEFKKAIEIDKPMFMQYAKETGEIQKGWEKLADSIAMRAHAGQVDKAGKDYINHPRMVAKMCQTTEEKVVALLHDVLEDTFVTEDNLVAYGFSQQIIEAVISVTKVRDNHYTYKNYLKEIKKNPLARTVKVADLKHNSDLSRLPEVSTSMKVKHIKYIQSLAFLYA